MAVKSRTFLGKDFIKGNPKKAGRKAGPDEVRLKGQVSRIYSYTQETQAVASRASWPT